MTTTYNKICELYKTNKIKGKYIITTNSDKLKRINYMKYNNKIDWTKQRKPYGFWFSVGDDWIKYLCENELERVANKYDYIINLKIIKSPKILIISGKTINKIIKNNKIDWKYILTNYDGLILNSNDIYDMDTDIGSYFYGWDIKSGVIWRNVNKYVEYGKKLI